MLAWAITIALVLIFSFSVSTEDGQMLRLGLLVTVIIYLLTYVIIMVLA